MGSVQRSPRIRPALKRVTFTNRIGGSVAAMKRSYELGIEAPEERKDEHRGAGRPLSWE